MVTCRSCYHCRDVYWAATKTCWSSHFHYHNECKFGGTRDTDVEYPEHECRAYELYARGKSRSISEDVLGSGPM